MAHGRDMPWRHRLRPYDIMVSEIMLQQTQVARVVPKFTAFLERFEDVASLAAAPLADVIAAWVGLGYNRRARYLQQAAKMVVHDFGGQFPATADQLQRLPGIGVNTAGAIMAYAYNQPAIFVETNIRTVYLHHFFADQTTVSDQAIRHLLELTIDRAAPRQWYWALMDYGSHLKATQPSQLARSRHYKKQARFEGSLRQLRGGLIRQLSQPVVDEQAWAKLVADDRFERAVAGLLKDGLVERHNNELRLTGGGQVS